MPKISIIIPAYNCGQKITRTIKSVLNQTFKDWELIVVDDGSTDNTKEIVLSFQKQDPRIKYIYQPNSGGPASPKNTGLKTATGEYIAFLDHDDEWYPQKLEKQLGIFSKSNNALGVVATNAMIINEENGEKKEYKLPKESNDPTLFLERNVIFCSSGVMVKKEVFSNLGFFDEKFKLGDDWDMWLRIQSRYNFDFMHEPLYIFYRHKGTVTSKIKGDSKIRDYNYGLSKHLNLYRQYPHQFSSRLLSIGRTCYIAGEKKKGLSFFAKSILINPLRGKAYINLFFGLFGSKSYNMLLSLRKIDKNI